MSRMTIRVSSVSLFICIYLVQFHSPLSHFGRITNAWASINGFEMTLGDVFTLTCLFGYFTCALWYAVTLLPKRAPRPQGQITPARVVHTPVRES